MPVNQQLAQIPIDMGKISGVHRKKRILLGQLSSNGDCLYATTIAKQIKYDHPKCHLTWAIGSICRSVLDGNPYVDEVWEILLKDTKEIVDIWPKFKQLAEERKRNGDFDEIYLTQIFPGNLQNYDGMIRSSIFRAYPNPITVPIAPVLKLLPHEIKNVRDFAVCHSLAKKKKCNIIRMFTKKRAVINNSKICAYSCGEINR